MAYQSLVTSLSLQTHPRFEITAGGLSFQSQPWRTIPLTSLGLPRPGEDQLSEEAEEGSDKETAEQHQHRQWHEPKWQCSQWVQSAEDRFLFCTLGSFTLPMHLPAEKVIIVALFPGSLHLGNPPPIIWDRSKWRVVSPFQISLWKSPPKTDGASSRLLDSPFWNRLRVSN